MEVPWIGRVALPGSLHERTVRVWTDGTAPTPDDRVEEIRDPFTLASPVHGGEQHQDAAVLARKLPPVSGGITGTLGQFELRPPLRPGKIVGIGRNFRAHAAELGNQVPAEPLLFFKPVSALLASGAPIVLPAGYDRIDFEGEVVVVIGRRGRNFEPDQALDYVAGYMLGNDVSCRDLQRRDGQWTRAKGFDTFAPVGPFVRITGAFPLPATARIRTWQDDAMQQDAPLSDMVFDIGYALSYLARCMTLEPGDLLFTGTPEGVAPLAPGQVIRVELEGFHLGRLTNPVTS